MKIKVFQYVIIRSNTWPYFSRWLEWLYLLWERHFYKQRMARSISLVILQRWIIHSDGIFSNFFLQYFWLQFLTMLHQISIDGAFNIWTTFLLYSVVIQLSVSTWIDAVEMLKCSPPPSRALSKHASLIHVMKVCKHLEPYLLLLCLELMVCNSIVILVCVILFDYRSDLRRYM